MKRHLTIAVLAAMAGSVSFSAPSALPVRKTPASLISECESFAGRQGLQHGVDMKTRGQALPSLVAGSKNILGMLSPYGREWGPCLQWGPQISIPPELFFVEWEPIFAPILPMLASDPAVAALLLKNSRDTAMLRGRMVTPEQLATDYWHEWGRWRRGQAMGDKALPFLAPPLLTVEAPPLLTPAQFLKMIP